jgi:hypothetical protein
LVALRAEDSHGSHTATAWFGRQEQCLADRNETRTEGKQSAHRRNFFDTSALLLGQIRQKGKSNVD